jgi:carboxypeptidase T
VVLDRLSASGLGFVACAAIGIGVYAAATSGTPSSVRRAVRVACAPAGVCELAEALASDVWSEARGPGLPLDVVLTDAALTRLAAAGATWQVLEPDVDAVAADEAARLARPAALRPTDWFAEYHDYEAIADHLRWLATLAPDRVRLQAIGGSVEGRPIWAVRLGTPGQVPVLINGTQHAREWIAGAVATCVADRLIREGDRDAALRDFLDHTDLWVVPVVNPDGYQYTWAGHRYWRKNRRGGFGVDLNRNFAVGWGGSGSSGTPRSDIYRGEYPFSEPESAALRDLVRRAHIAMHIDFHAFGQLVLYPWGYTGKPAPDRDRFAAVGDRMASAMYIPHETAYRLMSSVELYPAGGTMSDWLYGEARALSYTIELRPQRAGFVLPPAQIRPTCDEGLAALLALRGAR